LDGTSEIVGTSFGGPMREWRCGHLRLVDAYARLLFALMPPGASAGPRRSAWRLATVAIDALAIRYRATPR
jgi:hypothetical protein